MEISSNLTWPPEYNLRLSKKARHAHIKVIPNRGLEVVIPTRLQKTIIVADLLTEKKSWIEKHLASLQIKPLEHITSLSLQAINQIWHIKYQPTLSKQISAIIQPGNETHTITLCGNLHNITNTHRWLQTWLKQIAQQHLLPWLHALSIEHKLPYNKATIRAQQTLWGSCNAEKNISLNYKLLFIPAAFAQHVMLHELCHTKFLNHSKNFWNLLEKKDINSTMHNAEVRHADKHVPLCFSY